MDTLFIGCLCWHLLPQLKLLPLLTALFVCSFNAPIHAGSSAESKSFSVPASYVSFLLSIVLCVLFLSDPFLNLWDLLLVVVMVGFGARVMQPWDYSSGQIDSDKLNNQYMKNQRNEWAAFYVKSLKMATQWPAVQPLETFFPFSLLFSVEFV
ncbi:hypothetical protein ILYODFUR_009611 [Ilyodon furcidens]|uniref:Uncharacterized protein n=1 Tax=Ilyodon furcidens TaxID=33524 RepID=A0ABV0T9Z8_9TELE